MLILTMRTDKPDAELGLYEDNQQLAYRVWRAHRELSKTLHAEIDGLVSGSGHSLQDVQAIVCYKGPGSFTGLRIGLTVANALAYSLHIPIVGTMDPGWLERGITRVLSGETDHIIVPEYGGEAHITLPKK